MNKLNFSKKLAAIVLPAILILSGCTFGGGQSGPINQKPDVDTPVVDGDKPDSDNPGDTAPPIDLPKLDPEEIPGNPGEDPNSPGVPVPDGILPGFPGADSPEYGSEIVVGGSTMQELIESIKPNCELTFEDGKTCVSDCVEEIIENDENMHVYIGSMDQLIGFIAPNTTIIIEGGEYNLSDYISALWADFGPEWNDSHEYVQIEEVYDGVQLVIQNVDNLTIKGVDFNSVEHNDLPEEDEKVPGKNVETSIVVDPRYAAIFTFNNCSNITIADLELGHTEQGQCVGNVCDFYQTKGIVFANTDIYGCGVYGIQMEYDSGDLCVFDSNIHDCFYGPIETYDAVGNNMLISSYLVDSGWGGDFYLYEDEGSLYLYKCKLGMYESEEYEYNGAVTYECEWSEERPEPVY